MSEPTSSPTPTSTPSSHPQPEPAQIEGGLTQEVDSITDLFARDPLEWDEPGMDRMVKHYRAERVKIESLPNKEKTKSKEKIAPVDLSEAKTGADLLDKLGL